MLWFCSDCQAGAIGIPILFMGKLKIEPWIFGGTIFRQSHIFFRRDSLYDGEDVVPLFFPHGTSWHEMAMLDDLPLLNLIKLCCCHMRFPVLPSGNLTVCYGKIHPFFMGKLTISMAIFNSFLYVYHVGYQIGLRFQAVLAA